MPNPRSVYPVENPSHFWYLSCTRKKTKETNVTYILGDARHNLPLVLGDRTFDVALLVHVLEHIDDPDLLLKRIREVASTLIVEVPDFEADALNLVRYELGLPCYTDADHVREYSPDILRYQMERSGWVPTLQQRKKESVIMVASRMCDTQ